MRLNLLKAISRVMSACDVILWIGFSGLIVGSAQGQTKQARSDFPGLDIQVAAGWDGRVDLDAPVPVSFLISNQSDSLIEGHLILRGLETHEEINLGDVFIGPGSVRRFSSVLALTSWNDCVATYTDGDTVFWTRPVPLVTGKDFSEDVNYLLFVDDGGRSLQVPSSSAVTAQELADANGANTSGATAQSGSLEFLGGVDSTRFTPKRGTGRVVKPVTVKSWQIPQHPGPLTVAQGMLFSESAKPDMLNAAQWEAIGRWICLGGTVFVHDSSTDFLARLTKSLPLMVQPPAPLDDMLVHRCGGGSIRQYSGKLLSADDSATTQSVLTGAGKLYRQNVFSILDQTYNSKVSSPNASWTRQLVLGMFTVYTVFSGIVTLLLSRVSRRRIAIYTGTVVLLASISAIVLGGVLRTSRGDLDWHSVTLACPGGLVQVAEIDVRSAGGRNTGIAIHGKNADLQLLESRNRWNRRREFQQYSQYYDSNFGRYSNPSGYAAFSQQVNLLTDSPDACRIHVPITPWGFRRSTAVAYDPGPRGLDVKHTYQPKPSVREISNSGNVQEHGTWSVEVTNSLPFDVRDCRLLLMHCRVVVSSDSGLQNYRTGIVNPTGPVAQIVPSRATINIGQVASSATTRTVAEKFYFQDTNDYANQGYGGPPEEVVAAYRGATGAWIVGRLSKSTLLSIDDKDSDFEPQNESHVLVQEIPPEQLPSEWIEQCQKDLTTYDEQAEKLIIEMQQNQTDASF